MLQHIYIYNFIIYNAILSYHTYYVYLLVILHVPIHVTQMVFIFGQVIQQSTKFATFPVNIHDP